MASRQSREEMTLEFREVARKDLREVWNLLQRISRLPLSGNEFLDVYDAYVKDPSTMGVVAVRNHEVVAFGELAVMSLFRGGRVGALHNIVVKYEREGIGRDLVMELVERAEVAGCYKCVLEAHEDVAPFYRNLGFHSDGPSFAMQLG